MTKPKPSYEELENRVRELERKLSGRLSFEYLIKYISTSFVNLSVDKIDAGIIRALHLLSEFIGASRAAIYTVSDDNQSLENTHVWYECDPRPEERLDKSIPFEMFGFFWEQLCRSEFLIVNRIEEIPQKAVHEREWYDKNGYRSLLIIPMILEKRIYGVLCFSGPPRELKFWPEEFIILIRLIADRFMNLLNRKKFEIALIKSKKLVESLLNATDDSAMLISVRGTVLAVNSAFTHRLSKKKQDLIGLNIYENFPPGLPRSLKSHLEAVLKNRTPVHFEDKCREKTYYNVIYPVCGAMGKVERLALYSHDITGTKKGETSIRTLTSDLIKTQEHERLKIANDLHDNVAQELASLRIHCDALFDQIPDMNPHARDMLAGFSKTIKHSIKTVREMAYELHPPGFDRKGLVKTLYQYCEEFAQKTGVRVDFYSGGMDTIHLDFTMENTIHRIVQEALNNVRLHSGASQVVIRLVAASPSIILRIEDNGKGFDVTKALSQNSGKKKLGLRGIDGRVKLQNGKMKISSRSDSGTRIVIEMPYDPASAPHRRETAPIYNNVTSRAHENQQA